MATKVHMEALSPTMEEGQLVKWLKSEGDAITEGDVLAEIETDKATMELVARGSGVLQNVTLKEGQTAPVGEVIAVIAGEGEEVAAPATGGAAAAASGGDAAEREEKAAPPEGEEKAAAPKGEGMAGSAPERGSEAPGRPAVEEEQTPAAEGTGARGTAEGAEPKEAKGNAPSAAPAPSTAAAPLPTGRDGGGNGRDARVKASPLARRLAEEAGVDLSSVEGSGPGGRITKRDIEAASAGGAAAPAAGAEPAAAATAAAPSVSRGPDSEEVPVTQMRKAIAKRLVQSIGPVPTFYLTIECDMTRMMDLRERVNSALEKDGIKASINDFLIKAVAVALSRHPEVNASWGESTIVRHHRVHIGVAVAVEDGLITPIVRDADVKRVREIAVEVRELAGRAREKKLKPEEYTGATFSISNLGMFGIVEFTAIINPPEAAILAIGAAEEKVVAENGEMVVRPRMRMTMSCDHRVVDGAMGAKFLQTVRELIEDPMMMIA
ncbi:MAG TPA: pyruvate dehydrogenase complex dihydrolipoamide acetyltransferase [Longimicrobiales bacterium]|nr:pyruvate dehydrogenase complex dihydrolipoamide acetyltransferase [Longimicrobiales bacterium]